MLKMFPEAAFLLLLLASCQSEEEGPGAMEDEGAAGLVSMRVEMQGKGGIDWLSSPVEHKFYLISVLTK